MSTIDPNLIVRAGTIAPPSQDSAVRIIGRGLDTAPILREGLGITWLFAAVAAAGRVVVPILIQQAIDKGIDEETGDVQFDLIVKMALIGAVAVIVSGLCLRQASIRLGERSERALYDLRARLIGHIHQLSLATHNDERRGGLVSRVTSDIESLAQFFQWGGLAWLLDGTLMVIVAAVMLAYNWQLALDRVRRVDAPGVRAAGRAVAARAGLRRGSPRQRRHVGHDRRGGVGHADDPCLRRRRGARTAGARGGRGEDRRADQGVADRRVPLPVGRDLLGVHHLRRRRPSAFWMGPSDSLTAGALVGFIFLTYRFLEPIAEFTEVLDQTQNAVAGLRRVLSVLDLPDRPSAARRSRSRSRPARCASTSAT